MGKEYDPTLSPIALFVAASILYDIRKHTKFLQTSLCKRRGKTLRQGAAKIQQFWGPRSYPHFCRHGRHLRRTPEAASTLVRCSAESEAVLTLTAQRLLAWVSKNLRSAMERETVCNGSCLRPNQKNQKQLQQEALHTPCTAFCVLQSRVIASARWKPSS